MVGPPALAAPGEGAAFDNLCDAAVVPPADVELPPLLLPEAQPSVTTSSSARTNIFKAASGCFITGTSGGRRDAVAVAVAAAGDSNRCYIGAASARR